MSGAHTLFQNSWLRRYENMARAHCGCMVQTLSSATSLSKYVLNEMKSHKHTYTIPSTFVSWTNKTLVFQQTGKISAFRL